MSKKRLIPVQTIGLLSEMLPGKYTHSALDTLFFRADAPVENRYPFSNKRDKVQGWLRTTNDESEEPLQVLGTVLEEFMEASPPNSNYYGGRDFDAIDEAIAAFHADRDKIAKSLAKQSLQYSKGGYIVTGGATPTRSLQEQVKQTGLQSVEIEIRRALENVEKDPLAAAHNAGCVLEAALKVYLDHYGLPYKEDSDTLFDLWKIVVNHIGIRPKELEDKDLKKIASGLNSIVDGTMYLRNKKSSAHGKSEAQMKASNIRPRHARLAIHAAHTVSAYVLELLEVAHK